MLRASKMASNQANSGPSLALLSAKRFPQSLDFPLTAYSHAHDLLAVVTPEGSVTVFRITSGQVAFTIKTRKSESGVAALSWKPDGTCLGIGWHDGSYGVYDGGHGKKIVEVDYRTDAEEEWRLDTKVKEQEKKSKAEKEKEWRQDMSRQISIMGWMGHEIGATAGREKKRPTVDDWYDGLAEMDLSDGDSKRKTVPNDLPHAITTLDVTKILPRLSAIPPHGLKSELDNQTLASQSGVDEMFPSAKDLDAFDRLQSLLVCREGGSVQVLLDETVNIGTCRVGGEPDKHAAHPQSPSHVILVEDHEGRYMSNVIDLPLERLSGPLLHTIATNTKRIQMLLEYVLQTVRCIELDYDTGIAAPGRFLSILEDDLTAKGEGNAISNLFHLAMTGCYSPVLKEWMDDILKEHQVKRWDQNVNTMYSCIQNHLFENLLPALERLTIAVTRLRGLAKFYEGSTKFDCPPQLLSHILDKVDCLRLVAHRMLLICQTEHRQFRAFSKWLRMSVDIAIADPFSNSALETEQREVPNLDYSLVVAFIKETLMESKLGLHIKDRPSMGGETTKENFFEHPVVKEMSYEKAKDVLLQLDSLKSGEELGLKDVYDPAAMLNLPAITCSLIGHIRVALKHITDWQSKMLPKPVVRPIPVSRSSEMAIVSSGQGDVASKPEDNKEEKLVLISIGIKSPSTIFIERHIPSASDSSTSFAGDISTTTETLSLSPEESDLKIDEIVWIPHTSSAVLTLSKDAEGHSKIHRCTFGSEQKVELLHSFHANAAFKPYELLVGGRKGKLLLVVFGNQGREWRVLDLDGGVVQREDVNDREGNVGEDEMDIGT